MKLPVYMDSHATTPCDPRVVEAMLPTFTKMFGNAASRDHAFGWEAEALVEQARDRVAALIGADPVEIVFTSGATESDNLAIKGVAGVYGAKGRHVITCQTEHEAVLETCRSLEAGGFEVTRLPVQPDGLVRPDELAAAIRDDTILVSIMYANNEIGVIQPIGEIGRLCKARGVLFHCDAVQAMEWVAIDARALGVDLLSISGHKMHGPKGVGALYARRRGPRVRLQPQISGGGHERGLRSGTLNVPGIVGLGKAAEIVAAQREEDTRRVRGLRDRLLDAIASRLPKVVVNGSLERRLPNNLHLSFPGIRAETMLKGMRDLAVSSGAACASATQEPSHVLRALGVPDELAECSLRFGLHRFTTPEEVAFAADQVVRTVQRLREKIPRASIDI